MIYFIIAAVLSPPIETLIAVTASAGIAIGFASQDILKNIFGEIMILLDRPFQVGDKIEVGSYYGEVAQIGLRNEVHQGRSLLKMRLKAYVLDIRHEFPFMSEMTEIVVSEFLKHKLVTPEQLALTKA
ncbi:mechanosensitive ion channel family protein [candidate division KSB1 bacterium]|nr:mechanosensitive ion channel family protein [candidate division KSB1 bacterium]